MMKFALAVLTALMAFCASGQNSALCKQAIEDPTFHMPASLAFGHA
jgi:hypothetical protein